MIINEHTRIATLIKFNKESIEALAGAAKPFEKLRNPFLRRVLAGRTTLKQAARMGNCSVQVLVDALHPLGFEYRAADNEEDKTDTSIPSFVKNRAAFPKETLDVRADLAAGKDPLRQIMGIIKKLPDDHILQLINTFEPTPLINLLEKKGYECYVEMKGPEEVHAWFKKREDAAGAEDTVMELPETVAVGAFEKELNAFEDKVQRIDVREMEMPMPMVTILEALSQLPDGHAVFVQHRRVPVFLFNELKERSFVYRLLQVSDTDVRLLIYRP